MKKNLFVFIALLCYNISSSQTWGGSTSQNNDAYRVGNVGIGVTTGISQSLDLGGNLSIRGTHLVFNSQFGVIDWGGSGVGDLLFRTLPMQGNINSYTERMIIKNNGNVGLGISLPISKLHVYQPSSTSQDAFTIDHTYENAHSHAAVINISHDQTKAITIQRLSGSTATTVFQIWGNGTVNAKNVYAEALTVTPVSLSSWPDYVFKKDYKLMSILELEKFIQKNNHLPNIPSEADVTKDGLNIYNINKVLLEKIEEMSLYIIDLKKEIESIKLKINQ